MWFFRFSILIMILRFIFLRSLQSEPNLIISIAHFTSFLMFCWYHLQSPWCVYLHWFCYECPSLLRFEMTLKHSVCTTSVWTGAFCYHYVCDTVPCASFPIFILTVILIQKTVKYNNPYCKLFWRCRGNMTSSWFYFWFYIMFNLWHFCLLLAWIWV